MPGIGRRATSDLGKAIKELVVVVFDNGLLRGIVRGMKTRKPEPTRKILVVREAHSIPIEDLPELPDTDE
jgi:hypothetical protein